MTCTIMAPHHTVFTLTCLNCTKKLLIFGAGRSLNYSTHYTEYREANFSHGRIDPAKIHLVLERAHFEQVMRHEAEIVVKTISEPDPAPAVVSSRRMPNGARCIRFASPNHFGTHAFNIPKQINTMLIEQIDPHTAAPFVNDIARVHALISKGERGDMSSREALRLKTLLAPYLFETQASGEIHLIEGSAVPA